jgi:hypothetical protein
VLSVPMPAVLQVPLVASGAVTLTWSAVAGQTYQLETSSDLGAISWMSLGAPIPACAGYVTTTDSVGPEVKRFYRVGVLP